MTTPDRDYDMTPDMTPDTILAMDYALGALERGERRAVETRLRSDPAFRVLVEDWQAQLVSLDDETAAVPVPDSVWPGIAAEIAPIPHRKAVALPKPGLWQSLALWRGLAFAGTAAAVIAIAQINPPLPPPGAPPQLLVASLAGADGKPLLAAAYDPLRGSVVLTPATQRDDVGKSPELWVIEGEKPPRSLGIIDIRAPNAHALATKQLTGLQAGAILAISIEPLGGSKTGLPTGPVVATGKLSAV